MIGWGFSEGLTNLPKLEFDVIRIPEAGRRDTFSPEEFLDFCDYMDMWAVADYGSFESKERQVARSFFIILAESLMRVGELRQLKWKSVVSTCWVDERVVSEGIDEAIARIDIPAEISKTRKSRTVLTRVGAFFDNVNRLTVNNGRNDFVFTNVDNADQFSKKKLYQYWQELIEGAGIDKSERNLTPYSMRHWGITYRLLKGHSIWDVAKMAGTSVSFIETHYGHGEIESQRKMLESDRGGSSVDEIDRCLSK